MGICESQKSKKYDYKCTITSSDYIDSDVVKELKKTGFLDDNMEEQLKKSGLIKNNNSEKQMKKINKKVKEDLKKSGIIISDDNDTPINNAIFSSKVLPVQMMDIKVNEPIIDGNVKTLPPICLYK